MTNSENPCSFTWKIENFSMLPHQVGEHLESSKFTVEFLKEIDFNLWLYPRGRNREDDIICYLVSDTSPFEVVDLESSFLSMTLESTVPATKLPLYRTNFVFGRNFGWAKFVCDKVYTQKDLYFPQDTLILCCDLKLPDECTTKRTENDELKSVLNFMSNCCVSHTRFPIQRRSITWPIHDINKQLEQEHIISLPITSPSKGSPSLNLSLILDKNTVNDCIQIEIKQTDLSSAKKLFVKCKITVVTARAKFQDSQESTHLFCLKRGERWKFPAFIKIVNLTCDKYLLVDNTLLLQCDFSFTYPNIEYHVDNNYMPLTFNTDSNCKSNELSTSLEKVYANEKLFDIQLKTCGKTFPFYKLILCARSPVFSAMFENDMKEKNSSVIEITDVEPNTLSRMLTFMCSNVIKEELSHEDAAKLYVAADKYDVATLKNWCMVLLASSLSVSSVCDVLFLADAHHDNFLRSAVCNFIQCHSREVFHSTHWKEVMEKDPKLSSEIMLQFL